MRVDNRTIKQIIIKYKCPISIIDGMFDMLARAQSLFQD